MDFGLAAVAEAVEPTARQMERKLRSCIFYFVLLVLVIGLLGGSVYRVLGV